MTLKKPKTHRVRGFLKELRQQGARHGAEDAEGRLEARAADLLQGARPAALLLPLACLLVAKYTISEKMLENRKNGHPARYQADIRIISDLYLNHIGAPLSDRYLICYIKNT